MKVNIKIKGLCALVAAGLTLTSCNDLLDLEPISQITPESYYKSADQLAAYLNNYYNSFLTAPYTGAMYHTQTWNDGLAQSDNSTDIFVQSIGGNTTLFADDHWEVPSGKTLQGYYGNVRAINYLIDKANTSIKSGISGKAEDANSYLGEAYFFRAMIYYRILAHFGDAPIITRVLADNDAEIVANSERSPRNEVARFILNDLDTAITLLKNRSDYKGQRVNKQVAQLFKSRVALFEGTFEKYHKGSGRVPGDSNWPGAAMDYNSGKTFDIDSEVKFFLTEAKSAAKAVADYTALTANSHELQPAVGTVTGWNDYFEMFSRPSLAGVNEVLLWKQYSSELNVKHSAPYRTKIGCADGYTRAFAQSFLMQNGLPIYASGSGYAGDKSLASVKKDRDERLQLFVWDENLLIDSDPNSPTAGKTYYEFGLDTSAPEGRQQTHITSQETEKRCITGYQPRKYFCYDYNQTMNDEVRGTNACPIFRTAEAMLNYMEADCELNGGTSIDATSQGYWKALRTRAGVSTDYEATIAATDLDQELDWGVYSGTTQVSKMLYNIRRERLDELFSEGLRFADLIRWRSFDNMLTTKWIPEGVNFWDEMYQYYNDPLADGSNDAIVSSKSLSKYLRPYSRSMVSSNELRDGYKWHEAYYLYPLGISDLRTASSDRDLSTSKMYQNINWPESAGGHALK